MNFWLTFAGYEVVWFAAVIGAGRNMAWPGAVATVLFAVWRLAVSPQRRVEVRLIAVAFAIGIVFDAILAWSGLVRYAAPWPWTEVPVWLTALWIAFALTIVPLFGYLHRRPWLAALFGGIGGPLAYLGAAHGWNAVTFAAPIWPAFVALAIGWGLALPLLCLLAWRWLEPAAVPVGTGGAP